MYSSRRTATSASWYARAGRGEMGVQAAKNMLQLRQTRISLPQPGGRTGNSGLHESTPAYGRMPAQQGASMRALIAGLVLGSMLATGTAAAQLAPFNEVGMTMGHWHFASRDVEANKKIFVTMGGTPITGGNETVLFPGVRINLSLGNTPGSGESVGSVVNHVGFIVKNVQEQVAKWKANGVPDEPDMVHH